MDVTKLIFLLFLGLQFLGCGNAPSFNQAYRSPSPQCSDSAASNRYLVHKNSGEVLVEKISFSELEEKYQDSANLDDVRTIEPDYKVQLNDLTLSAAPGSGTWGIESSQASGAWNLGALGQNTVVAVIDSGIDYNHSQLRNRLNVNPAEASGRPGVDDDGNGFVDDVIGWNFATNSPDVYDTLGHGTHVSGIIAAEAGADPSAPRGVAPQTQILAIPFIDASGGGYISAAINAIDYAYSRGVTVVNASWGGGGCSTVLQQKIEMLNSRGILFVAAAGNEGNNIDELVEYPASLNLPNQITVGAANSADEMASFSNFGYIAVHLLAPGQGILSTYPGGGSAFMSGTSMATPFVTGAVALLKSYRPNASVAQIKSALLQSVIPSRYPVSTQGRLNISAALGRL